MEAVIIGVKPIVRPTSKEATKDHDTFQTCYLIICDVAKNFRVLLKSLTFCKHFHKHYNCISKKLRHTNI